MSDEQSEYEARVWYVHREHGQRGYEFERDGKKFIRYDRGEHSPELPFDSQLWEKESEPDRRLNDIQIANVLYEADEALCRQLLGPAHHRPPFMHLPHKERMTWFTKAPGGRKIRTRTWAYLKKALEEVRKDG